jgi:hypothetical protein
MIQEVAGRKPMSFESQRLIVELTKNYNKMTNKMISQCGKLCYRNYDLSDLMISEIRCLENCVSKYYKTYVLGEKFSNYISERINESRLNSFDDVVEKVEEATDRFNI